MILFKKDKEFLIVEKEEIKKISYFPQIKEEFSDKTNYSDINEFSYLKKREREEPKKSKKKQKSFSNLYNLKKQKKYRNGDMDMNMNRNLEQYLKSHRNKNKCLGCCSCIKKNKTNKNTGDNTFSNEANLKVEKENFHFEDIIKFPAFENPLECLNSESISKQDFNVYHEHLYMFLSNLTSAYCQKIRQLDEKKSNKKKYNNTNNNEKKKSRVKQILTDFDKGEIIRKIYTFNSNQIEEIQDKFNKYVTNENNELNFNIGGIPNNILLEMKEFVDKCYSDNLGNPLHQNYSKEIESKKKLSEHLNPKPIISYGDPRYLNNFQNMNLNKIRNSLFSDQDDEISNSLSSSSETSESASISEVERKIKKQSASNGCATSENFTSRNMMCKTFIEDGHSNSLSDREVCSSESDEI